MTKARCRVCGGIHKPVCKAPPRKMDTAIWQAILSPKTEVTSKGPAPTPSTCTHPRTNIVRPASAWPYGVTRYYCLSCCLTFDREER